MNPRLHAVVQIAPDARDRARGADAAFASGADIGPLHGVPFTVKDWIETDDLICAAGFAERAQFVPKRDATVVARMRPPARSCWARRPSTTALRCIRDQTTPTTSRARPAAAAAAKP